MDILEFITLVITGFTSCAEFGSYAFVHPVIRQLAPEHHIRVEQGLLTKLGKDIRAGHASVDDAVRNFFRFLCD